VRAVVSLLALVAGAALAVPAALADPTDPQKRFTPADQKLARGIVVTQADLPGTGWRGSRSPSSADPSLGCAGFRPDLSDLVETGRAEGLDLERADGLYVTSTTGVFRTPAMAKAAFARVAAPRLAGCLRSIFSESLGSQPGREVKKVTRRPSPVPRVTALTRGYRLEVLIAASGQTVRSVLGVVLLGRDRANVALLAVGIGRAFPTAPLAALARAVASRMAKT
jgi:hypothetical protein